MPCREIIETEDKFALFWKIMETCLARLSFPTVQQIHLFNRVSDIESLEAVFEEIREMQIQPSATTYNILINAYIDTNMHSEVGLTHFRH